VLYVLGKATETAKEHSINKIFYCHDWG